MKYKLFVLAFFLVNTLKGQYINPGLKIGDQVTAVVIPKIIHAAQATARMTDYKDRLLILDFWATNCSGCVAALPRMDSLQKHFGKDVKILPVTYEPSSMVQTFWKNNKYTKHLTLPSVVEDKLLSNYFKHKSIPHEVWIYKGTVIAITDEGYVDANNISRVLGGEKVFFPVKNDYLVFDNSKPLFTTDPKQIDTNNTSLKYVAISDYKEGVNAEGLSGGFGVVRNTYNKTIRCFFLNQPIFNSYTYCWSRILAVGALHKPSFLITPNQIIWEVGDRSKYMYIKGYQQDWIRANGICFESVKPDTGQTDQQVYRSIISDLDGLLGLKVRWEKRKENVLVLVKSDHGNKEQDQSVEGKSYRIDNLVYGLNLQEKNPYVFDESKSGEIELKLNISSLADIESVKRELRVHGYQLKEELREVDKFIFSEIDGGFLVDGNLIKEIAERKEAQKDLKNPSSEENKIFLEKNRIQKGIVILSSGLQYKILRGGSGTRPGINSKVMVNYTGMLVNGRIFDSSLENGRPSEFKVDGVISGMSEALKLMPVGAKWILYIPAALAYGDHTSGGRIPPGSNLIFELELLQILP
ncbi:FKBP-type peptidyl-prolyl cis-trans isomerase [Pedobacter cryoconitis]|uniref:peptidylprolyl isomerase n=1 Tax=Pedobacter cryoconitis TaxID=188932 RepID=A0A7X0MK43_9SPHI|nr:FKBP-type peptidyl-prolyl cis-trans isomerase [Pedobacter cryoconitis]MBB6501661.1 FKBP-type peptidyl-prolyl cis-trans isomerase/thiol-disulfide isomerase/thioredoxin [Pedobacter cryoconitis]